MTVKKLYDKLTERIPEELRCEWDNDGIMCSSDFSAEVNRILITLDVTEEIVDYAISRNFDLIISHHPLIFKPIDRLTEENHVSRKVIKLISNNVSVFSFHTRADKVSGGVNDLLCEAIGIVDAVPFGEDGLGRIGTLPEESELEEFCNNLKIDLGADAVRYADAYNTVKRIALVGGDGKDYVKAAIMAGADTYVSGRLSYNVMEEAADMGINLVEAGHYFTEFPVTSFFSSLVSSLDGNAYIEIADSNMIKMV
jgi:dinuclear metal center YbgI/SA1388 family protein